MPRYHPASIEPKWQEYWQRHKTFRTPDMPVGEKLYVLDMFPYPSGDGLHVGHPEGYTATDIVARFERMRGKCVLHPMGFDSFGLPAEEHAIQTNTPPRESTERNIANFTRQLKMLGFSYDWDRVLATTDVEYFRWTQWIFLVLFDTWFDEHQQRGRPIAELPIPGEVAQQGADAVRRYQDEHRLAYQADAMVNWCKALGTVLANEEVREGRSERGGHPVQRTALRQWMLRITAYADRLEKGLDEVDWPESIKKLQRDWIGRSTGADVDFYVGGRAEYQSWKQERRRRGFPRNPDDRALRVYTTRPDTLFGATYMVIAPEHPWVDRLTTAERRESVRAYCQTVGSKSDRERTELVKEKTGVFTGAYAVNPVNDQPVAVWVADYVLISYGSGAIMAVPAHDSRDFEFAMQFGLPIVAVVDPGAAEGADRRAVLAGQQCFTGEGVAVNSPGYNGLATAEFKERITCDLALRGLARAAVNYKLRDWLFSRQRFWGEPFPILHELDASGAATGVLRTTPIEDLPVDLPSLDDYKPHGRPEPLLAKAPEEWLYPVVGGKKCRRETNTMPQWAGSCWYYLRFIDPRNSREFCGPEKEKAWMPVDLYVGGAEHAVLHLLYARFWHKVLYDRGFVSTSEPFRRLVNQGMILGELEYTGYRADDGQWISCTEVVRKDGKLLAESTGRCVEPASVAWDQVEKRGDFFVLKDDPSVRVESRAYKMSKSRGNVENPDEIVRDYGADSLRLYEMFMGPLEAAKPWSTAGLHGVRNFLDRVWRMIVDERAESPALCSAVQDAAPGGEQNRVLHRTIREVTGDIVSLEFNTAIARMMEFVNYFTKQPVRPRAAMETFVLLLSPFAPHIGEELWRVLGRSQSLAFEPWPCYDESLARDETIEIPVQVQGRLRAVVQLPIDASREDLEQAGRSDPKVAKLIEGKQIVKVIVVPGRLVNFVVK